MRGQYWIGRTEYYLVRVSNTNPSMSAVNTKYANEWGQAELQRWK